MTDIRADFSDPAAGTALRQTPLYSLHLELGARMVPFAGYALPVQYPAGLVAEHRHTRQALQRWNRSCPLT